MGAGTTVVCSSPGRPVALKPGARSCPCARVLSYYLLAQRVVGWCADWGRGPRHECAHCPSCIAGICCWQINSSNYLYCV